MTEAHKAIRSEELLFERERQGVRTLTIVRGLFVLIVVTAVWVIGVSLFEKIATTVISILVLLAVWLFLSLLARRRFVGVVGLSGCFIDIASMIARPIIWYLSVGGTKVPPAYMLKTQLTGLTLGSVYIHLSQIMVAHKHSMAMKEQAVLS